MGIHDTSDLRDLLDFLLNARMACLAALLATTWLCLAAFRHCAEAGTSWSKAQFPGPFWNGEQMLLTAVRYEPDGYASAGDGSYPAVVMMHGCTGMWSNRNISASNQDGSPNLQNQVEKWGKKLAEEGMVALALDSFTPRGLLSVAEQGQCGGGSPVDPYTDRVLDARCAWEYLHALPQVDSARIGLLGWSHGAEATLVESAATPRDDTSLRPAFDLRFNATVSFYPGCGQALGFVTGEDPARAVGSSWWRPSRPLQLHVGEADDFHANCQTRAGIAMSDPYSADVSFPDYPYAQHSYDGLSQDWSCFKCSPLTLLTPANGGNCAMKSADIDALAFFRETLGLQARSFTVKHILPA